MLSTPTEREQNPPAPLARMLDWTSPAFVDISSEVASADHERGLVANTGPVWVSWSCDPRRGRFVWTLDLHGR